MFSTNNTIDDNSPLIVYEPKDAWFEGNNTTEPYTNYWGPGGTKTWTNALNATASFRFNGTSITIVGALRSNHGYFTVTLDNETHTRDGRAKGKDEYQKTLFTQGGLTEGMHEVIVRNTGGEFLDIDCIYWNSTSDAGTSEERNYMEKPSQDTDPAFVYSPNGAWNMNPTRLAEFSGSSGHSTNQRGASVNYTFIGETVSIYGTVGPNNSPYTVYLDDSLVGTFDATKNNSGTQVQLFHASNLGLGQHTVSLVNGEAGKVLEIDYAQSFSVLKPGEITSTGMPLPTGSVLPSPIRPRLNAGAIIGITLAAMVFILLILAIWLLNRRNKALWRRLHRGYMVQSQFDSNSTHSLIPTTGAGYSSRKNASENTQRSNHTQETSYSSEKYDHLPSFLPLSTSYDRNTSYRPPERRRAVPVPVPVPPAPVPVPVAPPVRSQTAQTYDTTASTLVAEDGSQAAEESRVRFTLLPRWGSRGQKLNPLSRDTLPSPRRSPSPTSRHLLHEEPEEHADDDRLSFIDDLGYDVANAVQYAPHEQVGRGRPPLPPLPGPSPP